ncbi:MAG: HAD family hydrolase [Candidatus Rokubacteria bacterium]|nr:HAD family hydrolase [Candidatus Rokubacteria bacterium]
MKITTVTIDFWGTLLFDGPGSDERYKRQRLNDFEVILRVAGVRASRGELDRAYEASGAYLARVWASHRDVPVRNHVDAILTALARDLPTHLPAAVLAQLLDAYSRPALVVPPAVDDGALAALEALAARGYTLALVSNTMRTPGATLRKLLERYRLLGCFKQTTFSDEVGVRKPAPEIFALTLRAVGGEPAAAVHVGDDTVLDVRGARAAGMRAIQVTSASLRALGAERPDAVIPRLAALPDAVASLDAG